MRLGLGFGDTKELGVAGKPGGVRRFRIGQELRGDGPGCLG